MKKGQFEFNKKKILIIDDEIYNCMAIKSLIKALKYKKMENVVTALSGKDALAIINKSFSS